MAEVSQKDLYPLTLKDGEKALKAGNYLLAIGCFEATESVVGLIKVISEAERKNDNQIKEKAINAYANLTGSQW